MGGNEKVVIVDMDGTLALNDHRKRYIQKPNQDWDSFFLACDEDRPNLPVITTVALLWGSAKIHIFSGRGEIAKEKTLQWLSGNQVAYDDLTMRPEGNFAPDEDLKRHWLLEKYPDYKNEVLCVFDDRNKVVAMWRSMGLACFQVAPGGF